ncbi:MAG: tetratricopeptide repeat protein [Candidatus Heimdallarchaeaceae archaeon]
MINFIEKEIVLESSKYSEIISNIDDYEKKSEKSSNEKRCLLILKVETAYEFSKVSDCQLFGYQLLILLEKEKILVAEDFYVYYYLIEVFSLLLSQNKKSKEILLHFQKNKSKVTKKDNDEVNAIYNLCQTLLIVYKDLPKALTLVKDSLNLVKDKKETKIYAFLKYREGKLNAQKGNLNQSLSCFEECLVYGELLNSKQIVNNTLISIGEIYRLKGNLNKAVELYNDALINYQEEENMFGISQVFNNIGIVYFSKGDFNLALDFFDKSINYAKLVKFNYIVAESTYYLTKLHILLGKISKANEYLNDFKKLSKKERNKFLNFYVQLTEASTLKEKKRFESQAKAISLLRTIIEKNEIYNEINIHAMLNLTEILLEELRIFNKSEIIEELKIINAKLLKIAEMQISRSLLAEAYWLKGKINLIQLNFDDAQDDLLKAQEIAFSQGLDNLAQKISLEYDSIVREHKKWKAILNSDVSIKQRIEKTHVDTLVSQMIQRVSYELETIEKDTPVMLLILNEYGIPLYSYNFSKEKYDSILFSGFLSALNSILKEVLATEGSIKQIEYHDYFLTFKNKEGIIFCYVFKGSSFSANKKLDNLVNTITKFKELWHKLSSIPKTGKFFDKKEEKRITELIQDSFVL